MTRVIKESFYVDDVMDGEDDEETAIETYHELNEVLNGCGLPLAKWTTNSSIVRAAINGANNDSIEIDKDDISGVLGLNWRPSIDAFHFTIKNPPQESDLTKRSIVADIARLYDPTGYLAPTIIIAKILRS